MHFMYVVKNPHTSSLKYILFFPGMKTFQLENLEKGVILKRLLGLNSDSFLQRVPLDSCTEIHLGSFPDALYISVKIFFLT